MHINALRVQQDRRTGLLSGANWLWTTATSMFIAQLAIPFAILRAKKTQRILLAIALLNTSLQIQKYLFLREDIASLGSIGGLQISLTNIALTGLYVAWLVRVAIRSRSLTPLRRIPSMVTIPAALLLLFYVASLLVAADVALGIFQIWCVLGLFMLYLYVAETVTTREDVLFIVRILLLGLIIQCLLMIAQAGGLVGNIDSYGIKATAEFGGDRRVSGTIGSPNPAAAYLMMMMLLALGTLLADVCRADKYLAGTGFAMAAVSLVFTLSRGGWIASLVGLATIMIFGGRRVSRSAIGAVVLLLVLLGILSRGVIAERLYSDDRGSAAARMPLNHLAGVMILDHPLLGVGANNFALAMDPYLAHGFSGDFLYTVHNTYLLVWAETGIGGLIAFLWFLIAIIRQGSRCWHLRDPIFASQAVGCAAAVIGFMVMMNFDPHRLGSGPVDLVWLCGGLVTAMNRITLESPGCSAS